MIGHTVLLGSLVALVESKALISNNCPQPVYVWSVPSVNSVYAANLRVNPGSRYEEPWRYGTFEHPGIALKVSTESNGINTGKPELDFAYVVSNKTGVHHVWNDLSSIRGNFSDHSVSFHNCHGSQATSDVQPSRCSPDYNIELALCGTKRTTPERDSIPVEKIAPCFAYRPGKPKPATTTTTATANSTTIKHNATTVTERITITKGHEYTATPGLPVPSRPAPPPSRLTSTPQYFSAMPRPAYHPHSDRPVARQVAEARDLEECEPRIVAL